jgi:Tfp pilus assembly protein PilV
MAPATRTIDDGLERVGRQSCPPSDSRAWTLAVTKRVDALRHETGFTIIEVLVAMFVLLLGVLATTTLLNTANAETERNQARNGAINVVRDIIEASRALPYEQVNPTIDANGNADTTIIDALQGMPPASGGSAGGSSFADANSSAAGWQIIRRGVTYTVTLHACVVDDAKDRVVTNHGSPAADGSGYYCPDLAAAPTTDPNGDDYRRVKVTAAWTSNSCNGCGTSGQAASPKTYSITQTGLIVNPSGGLGPTPVSPPTFTNAVDCRTVTINQVYPSGAVAVIFTVTDPDKTTSNQTTPTSVDTATGNKTFSFTYTKTAPNPPDNTYDVTIQAIDRSGRGGPFTTVSLYINCHEPPDVTGVHGGFDWRRCLNYPVECAAGDRIFDLDWNTSPDADVVGYYVWRVVGDPDFENASEPDTRVACVSRALQPPTDTTTIPGDVDFLEPFQPACYDTGIADATNVLPFPSLLTFLAGQKGRYWIQAVDMQPTNNPSVAPTQVRTTLTNRSSLFEVTENALNLRPSTPATLTVTNVNGQPCLSWPDSTDVDALGLSILNPVRFYRIYRDASVVANVTVVVHNPDNTTVSVQVPDVPYKDRVGRTQPNQPDSCDGANPTRSWFIDKSAPASAHYWVTAVDQDYQESFPSTVGNWTAP